MTEEVIELSIKRYEALLKAELMLLALERNGVDNWGWYSEAYQDYFKDAVKAGLEKEE